MSGITLDADGMVTVGNLRLRMEQEQELNIFDPRDNSNLGVMLCEHGRYSLGDPGYDEYRRALADWADDAPFKLADLIDWWKATYGATVVLPLYLIDHSGLAMRAGRSFADIDPGEWDSGLVGIIFDTPKGRDETGVVPDDVEQALRAEVEEYDRWLQGDVWSYVIERLVTCDQGAIHAEVVDACGGFIGHEYAEGEALRAFAYELKEENGV